MKLPLGVAMQFATAAERLPGRPLITVAEVRAGSLWWAFRSTKAKRDLGWKPSHHEDTLVDTIAWYREREGGVLSPAGARQPLALRVAGYGVRRASGLASSLGS